MTTSDSARRAQQALRERRKALPLSWYCRRYQHWLCRGRRGRARPIAPRCECECGHPDAELG